MTLRPLLLVIPLLAACGSTTTGGGTSDGGTSTLPIPIDQLFTSLTAAACESLFRCAPTRDSASVRAILGTQSQCTTAVQRLGGADIADLQRGVREGRVRYDAAAAARCLEGIRQRCDVNLSLDELCADVFQGTVAMGGQCFRHEECAGDAYCQGTNAMCPGVCRPRRAPGAACETDRQCGGAGAVPSRCVSSNGMFRCVQLTQGAAATEGQPCGVIVAEGATTGQRVACATGLYCRTQGGSGEGTCQRPLTAGSPCRSGDACEGSSLCAGNMCRAVTVQSAVGAPCGEAMFQACSPLANLTCTGGACASVGTGAEGAPCMTGDLYETFSCNPGLFCERATLRCAAKRATGSACVSDSECLSAECANNRCLDRQCNLSP